MDKTPYSIIEKIKIGRLLKIKFFIAALLIMTSHFTAQAQILISPTGDGGFETGASFALNNWIAANDGNSKWYVGTFVKSAGTRGVYIDVNGTAGAANNYNSAAIRVSHFYRDVTIPSGATNITLSFKWRAEGENGSGADDYDFLRVSLAPTSVTPVANALLSASYTIGTGKYNLQGVNVQTASITIPNALAGTTQRLVFTWRNDASLTNNPAAAVDEISLTYTPGTGCTGTPAPGNTVASANPVCSGSSFNLSLQNATPGTGITYQWQSSPNNSTWSNITGATSAIYSTSLTASTYYRCLVTCSGNTGTSNALQVTLNPAYNCGCTPVYSFSCSSDYISNVTFAGINNSSTCSGSLPSNLSTYASPNPSITGGSTYPISVSTDGDMEGINVWIDYNMNGTFESTESVLSGYVASVPNTYTGSVSVPLTVVAGQTKMRVRCNYSAAVTDPCASYSFGETEDYLITLVAAPPCTTPPVGGTVTGSSSFCAGGSANYSLAGGVGSIQWQVSTTAVSGPFTDISGQSAATYNFSTTGTGVYYLRAKRSSPGCVDDFSNAVTVTVNPSVVLTATASAPSVCPGSNVNLNVSNSVSYTNTTDYPIPDYVTSNGIANSPIVVSGFSPSTLGAVTLKSVTFNINHTYDGDLRIRIFCPAGNAITMVDQAGGAGQNFVNTTIVNSGAANGNVATGTAPFTGTYNSQISFAGIAGAANGTWNLRAIDLTGGDTGTILDWTLTLESDGVIYTWSSSPSGFSSSQQSPVASPIQNTTYSVQGNYNGCTNSSSVVVGVSPLPDSDPSSGSPYCAGSSFNLSGSNAAIGQTTTNWSWTGPNGFNDIQQNPAINNATVGASGYYKLTVTNSFGCTSSDSTYVEVVANPTLSVTNQVNVSCNGASTGSYNIVVTNNNNGGYLYNDSYSSPNSDGIFTGIPAGSYTVEVTDANSCSATIPVTITEPDPTTLPDAGPNQTACFGSTITLAANTAQVGTGTWTVVTGSGTFADANNPATTVTGLSAGLNTFSWTIANTLCGITNSDNVDIFMNSAPVISSCPSDITSCNTTVTFATPSATGTPAPSVVCSPSSGSTFSVGTTSVTCTATNSCGTSSCSFNVTVNEAPVIAACPSDITSCNTTVTFATPSATGTPTPSVVCSPASGSTFAVGTTSVTCTATNSCGTSSCSFNVTVNEAPVIGSCPSNITSCNPVVTFATPSATGTPAPSVVCSPASGSTFAVGTTSVTCTATNSCGTSSCSFNVIVNEAPVIGACPSDITSCNTTVTFAAPSATGTPTPSVVCSPASGSTFAVGTTSVTCTATNSCGTSSCSFNVTVNEAPVIGSCPSNITSCNPVVTFATPSATGTPAASVVCSPASGSTFSVGTTSVTCTATNSCGTSSCSFNVTVNALPTAVLSGTQEICNSSSANLTINFTGTGPWTYAVNGGAPVSTSNNPETVSVTPSVTTTYTITSLSDANCSSTGTGSAVVTVTNAPPPGSCTITAATIPTTAYACVGQTYVVSVNPVAGATKYTWSVPAGTLINGSTGPVTTTSNTVTLTLGAVPANASGWEICAFAANACGQTNTNCKYIRGALSMPSPIVGSIVACASTTGAYSTTAVSGALGYAWTGTSGITFTGSGLSVTANFPSGFTTGTICVAATLPCGYTGPTRCITVTNGVPILGAMSGTFSVCPGTNGVAYSVPAASGVQTYNWTLPTGITIASGTGTNAITVNVGAGFTTGNICVVATTACGINSASRCKTVSSNKPATPGNITGALSGLCGQTITYSIATVSGATSYTWTAPSGASLSSPNGLNSVDVTYTNGFTTGQLCVTANNTCGASTARCVNVKGTPSNPVAITGAATVCQNDAGISYSITPIFGATGYIWTVPSGATLVNGQNSTSILVDWGTTGGTIGVTATGICGNSGTTTKAVVVNNCTRATINALPGTTVNAYPNPVSTLLNIDVNTVASGTYSVELIDVSGRIVKTIQVNAIKGMNTHTIDVSDLSKGMYMLSVRNADGFTQQLRIAVQ